MSQLRLMLGGSKLKQAVKLIYKNHFLNSVQAIFFRQLNYSDKIPKFDPKRLLDIPAPSSPGRKLIIFDMDETLLHCKDQNVDECMIRKQVTFSNGVTITAGINIRQYTME